MQFPKLYKVKQHFDTSEITNVNTKIKEELEKVNASEQIKGKKVGITAGSRGIKYIDQMYKAVVEYVKENGGEPYLISAMGSHGGGTVEGQLAILESLNVTESTMGCPILASAHADKIGETPDGIPAYVNERVKEVDKVIVINRIKEHTDFTAIIESGLHKMMTIGLGTINGADSAHLNAMKYGYFHTITEIGKVIKDHLDLICGIGIIENAICHIHTIEAIKPENFWDREVALQKLSKQKTAKIPFNVFDILLVKEIGKNISGGGMDSKVIGRIRELGQIDPEFPDIKRISVFSVTPESHGNFCGLGLGDFSTMKVFNECNSHQAIRDTVINCVVSMTPEYATYPCLLDDEKEMIEQSFRNIGAVDSLDAKLVYIKNTKELEEIFISEALLEEAKANKSLEIYNEVYEFEFDEKNDMTVPML
ncbi:MAG: DUF2088 domain-containing protein [Tissierellales bacterium]|nr:DUF2088 domain-containing protein [Tissierellales bacterium]MBN2826914.1 DUF2088 domain-containing protein [Tissierellales bacterium]